MSDDLDESKGVTMRVLIASWAIEAAADKLVAALSEQVRCAKELAATMRVSARRAAFDDDDDEGNPGKDATVGTLCHDFAPPPDSCACHDDPPSSPIVEETPQNSTSA